MSKEQLANTLIRPYFESFLLSLMNLIIFKKKTPENRGLNINFINYPATTSNLNVADTSLCNLISAS